MQNTDSIRDHTVAIRNYCALLQAHADYEQRLQEEVNARLLKEQELMQLVCAILEPAVFWT